MKFPRVIVPLLAICCMYGGSALAQKKATLDPKEGGVDFQLQGEYQGEFRGDDGATTVGVQVIALGKGQFRAVGYTGGLPGDGWDGEDRSEIEGKLENGEVRFATKDIVGVLKNTGQLTAETKGGKVLGTLKKVVRKSPTLGKKPPQGATVLFDGTTADKFQGGKLTDEGYLQQGVTSKQKFGGFQLHMEFQLAFMPAAQGQQRANSGLYLQGRHEVQILDSFGLEGKNNECGGIYEIRDPDVNMCFPPLSWQTYDVDFTPAKFDAAGKKTANARVTVRHNGVVIHNNVEVPKATRAAPVKEGAAPGPIYLQDHRNPVRFKNIWLVEK